jgi:pimeloyl-ACP methyl ester carboxylesterase
MDMSIKKPSLLMLALENRAFLEFWAGLINTPFLKQETVGRGRAVLVIPGFGANDISTVLLRRYLNKQGFKAAGWGMGINQGTSPRIKKELYHQVKQLRQETGQKVSVIGWSLGGIFARELGRKFEDDVHSVITMGTPFSANPYGNYLFQLSLILSGKRFSQKDADAFDRRSEPPPVKTIAIHSRYDGVVAWECSLEKEGDHTRNIEVFSSHFGYPFNPDVFKTITEALVDVPEALIDS